MPTGGGSSNDWSGSAGKKKVNAKGLAFFFAIDLAAFRLAPGIDSCLLEATIAHSHLFFTCGMKEAQKKGSLCSSEPRLDCWSFFGSIFSRSISLLHQPPKTNNSRLPAPPSPAAPRLPPPPRQPSHRASPPRSSAWRWAPSREPASSSRSRLFAALPLARPSSPLAPRTSRSPR